MTKISNCLKSIRRIIVRNRPIQRRIESGFRLPQLPYQATVEGSVWAVTMVRNEADVIEHTVRHLLAQGADGIIVSDNLSTDETPRILERLALEDARVFVAKDKSNAYYQGRKMSYLANLARKSGADWVILFDADEFWFAEDTSVTDYLRSRSSQTRVVEASLFNAYATSTAGIDLSNKSTLVRLNHDATSKKVAIRPRSWVWVDNGNHSALDLGRADDFGLRIVHLPLRTFEQFERKVIQGAESSRAVVGLPDDFANHWKSAADAGRAHREELWAKEVHESTGGLEAIPTVWSTWNDRRRVESETNDIV